jgi:hypothetical protein
MKRFLLFFMVSTAQAAQLYYSPVTVDHTKVPSTQTNFPILISKTDTRLKTIGNGGHVNNASGFDIRPYSDSALTTALTYELSVYDGSAGTVLMWVNIASLSSSADTVVYLGYGDTGLTTDGSSTSTWDSNYMGVWHMQDNAANTTIRDSTSNAKNAVNVANTSTKTVTGQIGNALTYNGTSDSSSVAIDLSGLGANYTVTVSMWVNWTTNANDSKYLYSYAPNDGSHAGLLGVWNFSSAGTTVVGQTDGFSNFYTDKFTRASQATWHLFHHYATKVAQDNATNKAYIDGTLQTLTTDSHLISNVSLPNNSLYWMSNGGTANFGLGSVDEVRLSKIERTQDWITVEFNNQSNPGTFETLGTEVSVGGAPTTTSLRSMFFSIP